METNGGISNLMQFKVEFTIPSAQWSACVTCLHTQKHRNTLTDMQDVVMYQEEMMQGTRSLQKQVKDLDSSSSKEISEL